MALLDHRGKPISADNPPAFAEVGRSGLRRFGGFVREEWHQDLRGPQAVKIYREMADNHPIIGAAFLAVEMLARQVEYRADATGDTPMHETARELAETALEDVKGGVIGILSNALTMLPFGWSVLEKVYKVSRGDHESEMLRSKFDDGAIRWRKLGIRAQESLHRWEFDDAGEMIAMIQRAAPDFRERRIPRKKMIHIRLLDRKNNPEGRSLLRTCYTSYYFQKLIQFTEAVGIERNLAGFPKFTLPVEMLDPNASPEVKAAVEDYKEMGRKTRADEYACWVFPADTDQDGNPTGYTAELISSSGKNVAETDPIIKRYASWIAVGLMAKFLMIGIDKHGSFALQSSETELFALSVAAVIDTVLDALNEQALPELMALNGIPREFTPEYAHGDIEKVDMAALSGFVSTLAGTGALTLDDKLEDHLRSEGGLPPRVDSGTAGVRTEITPRPGDGAAEISAEDVQSALDAA